MKIKNSEIPSLLSVSLAACLIVCCALFSSACQSKELSRSQAASMINSSEDFKYPATVDLNKSSIRDRLISVPANETPEQTINGIIEAYKDENPETALLFHLGLVDPVITKTDVTTSKSQFQSKPDDVGFWRFDMKLQPNDKAGAYWKEYDSASDKTSIPTARKELIEVTGITKQGETNAAVDYTYKWNANEFGKYFDAGTTEFKSLPVELREGLEGKPSRNGGGNRKKSLAGWDSVQQGRAMFQKFDDGWRMVQ